MAPSKRLTTIGVLILGSLQLVGTPARAHEVTGDASAVHEITAVAAGDTIEVSGHAGFGGQSLVTVGTDPAGDAPFPGAPPNPYDLVGAKIGQLDPETSDLTFLLELSDIPVDPRTHQAVTYMWYFKTQRPGEQWPNPVSIRGWTDTSDDEGEVEYEFVLDEGCVPSMWWVSIGTCETIMRLEPELTGDHIVLTVPLDVLRPFPSGSTILPDDTCHGISASISLETVCNPLHPPLAADVLTQDAVADVYPIASRQVEVILSRPGEGPIHSVPAAVDSEGGFTAGIPSAGLAAGTYEVTAEACFGSNCGSRSTEVEI